MGLGERTCLWDSALNLMFLFGNQEDGEINENSPHHDSMIGEDSPLASNLPFNLFA
jgi:hypothetical protein